MQKNKNSTIELHNIKQDIFLGFLAQQELNITAQSYQLSFFGGSPLWLHSPKQSQQLCSDCKINLTFLGQMYCPFDADHCYHRILYFLFCQKCLKEFRCIRQQAQQSWKQSQDIKSNVKKLCEPHQIQNDPYPKNQLNKLFNKTRTQIEEQQAIQQADSQDQQDVMNQINSEAVEETKKYDQKQEINGKQEDEQQNGKKNVNEKKDILFETYKKVIVQLNNPCILYTDVPLLYNKRVLNPQHFCKGCQSKLSLQVQITQRILSLDNDPNSKLLQMDWGSIMVYTCLSSCSESEEECVVVQYEIDAIGYEDIKKLNKHKKNKKKKQKKSKSKSKSKEKGRKNAKEEGKQSSSSDQQKDQKNKLSNAAEQGDWD